MIDFPALARLPEPHLYTGCNVLRSNHVLLSGDWEIPDTDPRMIKLLLALQRTYSIPNLVIGGDIVAANAEALSGFVEAWQEEGINRPFHVEARTAAQIIKEMTSVFTGIDIIEGNHDRKVARATKGQVDLHSYLDLVGVKMSHYSYMIIETACGPYYICHPDKGGGSNIYAVGNKIYRRTHYNGEKCHIVYFHTHLAGTVPSEDGLRWINAVGATRDPLRTKYMMTNPSNYPVWRQSVGMIRDGYFENIILGYTDLRRYLSDDLIAWVMNPVLTKQPSVA